MSCYFLYKESSSENNVLNDQNNVFFLTLTNRQNKCFLFYGSKLCSSLDLCSTILQFYSIPNWRQHDVFLNNFFLKTLHTLFHFVCSCLSPLHNGWRAFRDEPDIGVFCPESHSVRSANFLYICWIKLNKSKCLTSEINKHILLLWFWCMLMKMFCKCGIVKNLNSNDFNIKD